MSLTIEQGQVEIARILREEAAKQGVKIDRVKWFSMMGEEPPPHYNLEVHGASGAMHETDFTPRHLTELDTDNQMKMPVHQKVIAVVVRLKRHER